MSGSDGFHCHPEGSLKTGLIVYFMKSCLDKKPNEY